MIVLYTRCIVTPIFVKGPGQQSPTPSRHALQFSEHVSQQVSQTGLNVGLVENLWDGIYQLYPTNIYDAALRWTEGMYIKDSAMCLSFQIKKRIPIGKGGMILCDSKEEYDWLKLASYDGRDLNTPYDSKGHVKMEGWHYYMTPEDAARGIILMDKTPRVNSDQGGWKNYPAV